MKFVLIGTAAIALMVNIYFALFHGSALAGLGVGLMVAAVFVEPTIQIKQYG